MEDENQQQNNLPLLQDIHLHLSNNLMIQHSFPESANLENFEELDNLLEVGQNDYEFPSEMLDKIGNLAATISVPPSKEPSVLHVPSSLPAMEDWPGNYSFNVSFRNNPDNLKKTAPWIFSEMKNKLYVRKDAPCSINFSTNTYLKNAIIRAVLYFTSPEDALEVVKRCLNHSMEELKQNIFEAEHLVRCSSSMATYEIDQVTGKHSVIVPFENPSAGQQYSTYIYKFLCFGSCAGGPNRRPMSLVFTLECQNQVIGRKKFDLKVCSTPGRDIETEEKQLQSGNSRRGTETNILSGACNKRKLTKPALPPAKKKDFSSKNDRQYCIKTKDLHCYRFLKQMKHVYELGCMLKFNRRIAKFHVYSAFSSEEETSGSN